MLTTFQCNILQHCCMMLQHVLNRLAKRTQYFLHFQCNIWMLMCPAGTWCTTCGLRAHVLVQHECGDTSTSSCNVQNEAQKI